VDTAGEEQNRLIKLETLIIFCFGFISLNSSGENYGNVILPSDSTASDPTKSFIPEVSFSFSIENI